MARRSLDGCRAIVTGASSGIGRALSLELAKRGARLMVAARRQQRLAALCEEVAAAGGEASLVVADVTDPQGRDAILQQVEKDWSGLDLLINNAGIGAWGPFAEADEQRLRKIMEANFFAPAELIRQSLPLLRRGNRPMVANVCSVLGHRAVPNKSEYSASKFAMHGLSDALRAELSGEGIDVLLVSPSTTSSEFFERVIDKPAASTKLRGAMSPERVAIKTARAIERGKHEIILSAGGKTLVWLDRLFPSLMNWMVARHG